MCNSRVSSANIGLQSQSCLSCPGSSPSRCSLSLSSIFFRKALIPPKQLRYGLIRIAWLNSVPCQARLSSREVGRCKFLSVLGMRWGFTLSQTIELLSRYGISECGHDEETRKGVAYVKCNAVFGRNFGCPCVLVWG